MSELRLNLLTREWVVIATERAHRPRDYISERVRPPLPPYLKSCPFCPGNEDKTRDEYMRLDAKPPAKGWRTRVVANKYPAVSLEGDKKRIMDGIRRCVTGVGIHEIIIESAAHNETMAHFDRTHLGDLIHIYKNRFIESYRDPRVEHVIIFKNHGLGAGTSIEHPHSQLIATPVVPVQFRDRVQAAMHFFDDTGECLVCSITGREILDRTRVIIDTDHFLTFIPYAALSPFHTWIFPKRHCATFSDIREDEVADLAAHLKEIMMRYYHGFDNPDFNLVIRSSRPQDIANEYCHWYISIVPRMSMVAGFELGSGMFINTNLPEASAELVRAVRLP
jgi:UDPglucose--hexose-1-phosphate uridylyltransferase